MSHSTQTLLLVDLFFIHLQIYVFLLLDVNTGSNLLYLICKPGKSRFVKVTIYANIPTIYASIPTMLECSSNHHFIILLMIVKKVMLV